MINLKSTSETKKTFSMTFNIDNEKDLKQAKAISILFGNFNQLRREIKNPDKVYNMLKKLKNSCELENIVFDFFNELY